VIVEEAIASSPPDRDGERVRQWQKRKLARVAAGLNERLGMSLEE